ncbi:MAG: WD40 repeat domain-containing protein, partial [Pseudonocardiaceae bacterium]
ALRTLVGHSDDVNGVALYPAGGLLASASSDHTVRLWDMARGRNAASSTGCASSGAIARSF